MEDLHNNKEAGENIIDTIGDAVKDFLGLEDEPNKEVDKTGGTGKTYVSAEQLNEIGWVNVDDAMLKDLNNVCLKTYKITTLQRIRHFISQCSVESGAGKYKMEQSWDKNKTAGEQYEGRKDLGNIHPGDGVKYRGAGYIQLTGRNNYQKFADSIQDPKVMEGAEYVADKYPWTSAGFFWDMNQINVLCDKGASVKEITYKVNHGYNGLAEREKYYQKCTEILKDDKH